MKFFDGKYENDTRLQEAFEGRRGGGETEAELAPSSWAEIVRIWRTCKIWRKIQNLPNLKKKLKPAKFEEKNKTYKI